MHHFSFLILATVVAGSIAAVLPGSGQLISRGTPRAYIPDECQSSTFINEFQAGLSPLSSDCIAMLSAMHDGPAQDIRYRYMGDGPSDGFLSMLAYRTCTFGVRAFDGKLASSAYIGSVDIRDVVHDAIAKFQVAGRVGASGVMPCNFVAGDATKIQWRIYYAVQPPAHQMGTKTKKE